MPSKPSTCDGCDDYFPYAGDDGVEIPPDCSRDHLNEARRNAGCEEHTRYHTKCESCLALPVCATSVELYGPECLRYLENIRRLRDKP